MEFVDFRHPLFSISIILLLVIVIALANHAWSLYRAQKERQKLTRFLEKFEANKELKSYKDILKTEPNSANSLMLLASIYYKSGDYNETISICVALLEIIEIKDSKIEIMSLLARTYLKAGFYQRSRDVLLDQLKMKSRNKEALKLLLVIYEQMHEYKKALEVIESLEELGFDEKDSAQISEIELIKNDATLSVESKIKKLIEIEEDKPTRELLEFLFVNDPKLAWQKAIKIDNYELLDLFWNIPDLQVDREVVEKNRILSEIYSAKGLYDLAKSSEVFELDLLIRLTEKNIATLQFEYNCKECLASFPLYFARCPSCFAPNSAKLSWSIAREYKGSYENSANLY